MSTYTVLLCIFWRLTYCTLYSIQNHLHTKYFMYFSHKFEHWIILIRIKYSVLYRKRDDSVLGAVLMTFGCPYVDSTIGRTLIIGCREMHFANSLPEEETWVALTTNERLCREMPYNLCVTLRVYHHCVPFTIHLVGFAVHVT